MPGTPEPLAAGAPLGPQRIPGGVPASRPYVMHDPALALTSLGQVLAAIPEGLGVTGADGRVLAVNEALCRMVSRSQDDLVGHPLRDLVAADDLGLVDGWLERARAGDLSVPRVEHRMLAGSGEVWVEHSVGRIGPSEDSPGLLVHLVSDRTDARRTQVDLAYRADHDAQTGLANRASLRTRLGLRLGAPSPRSGAVGVLFCDVDHLKKINDQHGHLAGDEVISRVAARLAGAVRHQDLVARMGGDEFVIVLDHCRSRRELAVVARNVQRRASRPVQTAAGRIPVSITVGAVLVEGTADTDDALARADRALYEAKRSGRNRFAVFGPT